MAAFVQTVAEVGVRDEDGGSQTGGGEVVEHVQRQLPLGAVVLGLGNPAGPSAGFGFGFGFGFVPGGGQEQPPGQGT